MGNATSTTSDPVVELATNPTRTIVDTFRERVERQGPHPALRHLRHGRWEPITWRTYGEAVREVTAGLAELGVDVGTRIGILATNRFEWHVADMGVLCGAGVTVPVYPTSAASQVAYVLDHSDARICFVENHDQLAKILDQRDALPRLERAVIFEDTDVLDDPFVMTFSELRALGAEHEHRDPELLERRTKAIGPDSLATLVYTSGTTGPPKGAMITHGNIMSTIASVTAIVDIGEDDRFLSFLPLSHVAERVVSHFGQIVSGGETWFARSFSTLHDDLQSCRPTIFFAVPRVWEKLHDGIIEHAAGTPRRSRLLFERYLALGESHVASQQGDRRGNPLERVLYGVLDRAVGAKLRARIGLDQGRLLVSGAAPIHPDLVRWFHGIGLPIAEVYGQTEDCGPTSLNPPDHVKIGTVGLPLPGVAVRIAADGEILVRGGNVCGGYFKNTTGTDELIDDDGWMHSGDVGSFDRDGYLRVTDRKKDLIITAHGKNIAPQEIETRLRKEPLVSQAVVIGDGRPYLTALLTLDADGLTPWATQRGMLLNVEALAADPDVHAEIAASVARVNAEVSHVEQIKKWRILPRDLTIADGELTPTLKVRRKTVVENHMSLIDELYADQARTDEVPANQS